MCSILYLILQWGLDFINSFCSSAGLSYTSLSRLVHNYWCAIWTNNKKPSPKVVDVDSRPFIDQFVIDVEFLWEHSLMRVVELLEDPRMGKALS